MIIEEKIINEELSNEEKALYKRQSGLMGWDQQLIKDSRVLIAGAGALGCEIAKNFVRIGIGHLDILDIDTIDTSNLTRQMLYRPGDEGRPKSEVAVERLREMNPHVSIEGYHTSLERLNPMLYKIADVVVTSLDSAKARVNLNILCERFHKPLVDGGVGGYHGIFYTHFPSINPCLAEIPRGMVVRRGVPRRRIQCVHNAFGMFREHRSDEIHDVRNNEHIDYIRSYANTLVKKHDFQPLFTRDEIINAIFTGPQLITTVSTIAAIQSHETIKILHSLKGNNLLGEPFKKCLLFNGITMQFFPLEIKRNPNCPVCGEKVKHIDITIKRDTKCKQIIQELNYLGFEPAPIEQQPNLIVMDFNGVKQLDLECNPIQNQLRDLELIIATGFKTKKIYITLKII